MSSIAWLREEKQRKYMDLSHFSTHFGHIFVVLVLSGCHGNLDHRRIWLVESSCSGIDWNGMLARSGSFPETRTSNLLGNFYFGLHFSNLEDKFLPSYTKFATLFYGNYSTSLQNRSPEPCPQFPSQLIKPRSAEIRMKIPSFRSSRWRRSLQKWLWKLPWYSTSFIHVSFCWLCIFYLFNVLWS
jgi:hypothetical protein